MLNRPKTLIIKLGYSETLDQEISTTTSLGDVLRTTVILPALEGDHISWLVDMAAYPLLENNRMVHRILPYNLETTLQLRRERFDTVINLEKVPGLCALSDSVNAWRRFGFRFNELTGEAEAHDGADKVMSLCRNQDIKRSSKEYWQEMIFAMLGKKWNGEEYSLGYQPRPAKKFDIGLNWAVGKKWPNKGWPQHKWDELAKRLDGKYSVDWQKGMENLQEYMDWIASHELIVTNDSLGLHIALAMGKKVVALYGPTSSSEIFLYERGLAITPIGTGYDCVPCISTSCNRERSCMDFIKVDTVINGLERLLPK